jgi:MoaA/NifB/PqqE/SkfB family radical SAM enzyme
MLSPIKIWKDEDYPLFTTISVEIGAKCNRHCVFCPNHDFKRTDEFMPMKLIEKQADELGELNYRGSWGPFIYNEPLRDERILDIVRLMRERVPRCVINFNTNCDYLTEELLDELFDAGVNQLACNIYSSRDGKDNPDVVAKGVKIAKARAKEVQSWLDARDWIDQESSLYTGGSAKKTIAKVQHKYGVDANGKNFGGGFGFTNRAGNVDWLTSIQTKKTFSGVCTKPFRIMQINWTGDCILCCNDYNGVTNYGNLKTHTLVEMWNNIELNRERFNLQRGVRKGLCASCDYNGGAYKHMIHPVELHRKSPA